MSSQPKPTHTKIIDVYRSKTAKKTEIDPREHLFFKIKPEKSQNDLLVPYKDLRDNFPYALIQYYQSKLKVKNETTQATEPFDPKLKQLPSQTQQRKRQLQKVASQEHSKPLKTTFLKDPTPADEGLEAMFDYDQYSQDFELTGKKVFHALFSQSELQQNRYLRDLNEDESRVEQRRGSGGDFQARKKIKMDQ